MLSTLQTTYRDGIVSSTRRDEEKLVRDSTNFNYGCVLHLLNVGHVGRRMQDVVGGVKNNWVSHVFKPKLNHSSCIVGIYIKVNPKCTPLK